MQYNKFYVVMVTVVVRYRQKLKINTDIPFHNNSFVREFQNFKCSVDFFKLFFLLQM